MPKPDLPFDEEFLDYARKALAMAGLEPDREWLELRPIALSPLDVLSEQPDRYRHARGAVPKSHADWEQAMFLQPAFWAALWDLGRGRITSFRQFEFLYRRLMGEEALPYLPMVFAAACLSPSLDREFGLDMLATLRQVID